MFVVVHLKLCKKRIVVPENWLFDVNQELLKNQGVNSNRDVLIFWSKNGLVDDEPSVEFEPNFQLDKATTFPPPNTEAACYIGRIIRYFGK